MKYEVTYKRVYDKNDEIVDISTITEENRRFEYYSIGSHTPMEPVLGEERQHYFRAKKGYKFNAKTELHEYSKKVLKYRFDHDEHFYIQLLQQPKCKHSESCIFYDSEETDKFCCGQLGSIDYITYDLKDYYDTAILEGEYGGFVADVLLTDSKNKERNPIFLEVAVTHMCSEEKKNSGNKIIELIVNGERDAYAEITQNFEEAEIDINFYEFTEYYLKDKCCHYCTKTTRALLQPVNNNKIHPTTYYCIPQELSPSPIQAYNNVLQTGMLFACTNINGRTEYLYVFDKAISNDGCHLVVMCQNVNGYVINGVKTRPFFVFRISWTGRFFFHKTKCFYSYRSASAHYEFAKEKDWDDIE